MDEDQMLQRLVQAVERIAAALEVQNERDDQARRLHEQLLGSSGHAA